MSTLAKEIIKITGINCTKDFKYDCIEKIDNVLDNSKDLTNEALVNKIMNDLKINFPNKKEIKDHILEILK